MLLMNGALRPASAGEKQMTPAPSLMLPPGTVMVSRAALVPALVTVHRI